MPDPFHRLRRKRSPTEDARAQRLKELAEPIWHELRSLQKAPQCARAASIAITKLEDAVLWAVKAACSDNTLLEPTLEEPAPANFTSPEPAATAPVAEPAAPSDREELPPAPLRRRGPSRLGRSNREPSDQELVG